jgi:hypothetical protein
MEEPTNRCASIPCTKAGDKGVALLAEWYNYFRERGGGKVWLFQKKKL